jgi:uncharacterized protein (TIGR03067 family)
MKHLLCLCLLVGLAAPAEDAQALQGKWKPVIGELGAPPMAEDLLRTISLKLDHGKYEVFVGDEPDRGTYTFDASTHPKSMTVVGTEGPTGRTFPAIYELNGDTLRICSDLSGAQRPAKFETLAGPKLYLVTYRRDKTP